MIDTAVILAAGKGERLRKSMGNDVPKPLQLIKGGPLITRVINNIRSIGIKNVHVVVGYKAELIVKYFSHVLVRTVYDDIDLNFIYNPNYELHSGISLLGAEESVAGKPFLCCMGDHLIEAGALKTLLRAHERCAPYSYMLVDYILHDPFGFDPPTFAIVNRSKMEILAVGDYPEEDPGVYDAVAQDVGAFIFTSSISGSIFSFIKKIQHKHGDCDLKEAINLLAYTMFLAPVDVFPWSWDNINTAEDLKMAECDKHLCP